MLPTTQYLGSHQDEATKQPIVFDKLALTLVYADLYTQLVIHDRRKDLARLSRDRERRNISMCQLQ